MVQYHCERPPVFSVTSEAAASLSFQAPPPRSAKPDPSQGNDRFQTLIDSTVPADTANDRANSTAQQRPVSQRRADDAPATADTKRPRDAGPADQAGRNNSEDRDATSRQSSEADSNANTDPIQRSDGGPNTLKADTARPIEKKSTDPKVTSDTASAADFSSAPDSSPVAADSGQRDAAASVTTPNPIAVAIAVTIVATDSPATPALGNTTAPLAIAAAAIAASSPASAAPAASPAQSDTDALAAVTTSAAASVPAVVATTSSDAAANAKVPVQAAASQAVAGSMQQAKTQSTDPALTAAVAVAAPVEAKTTLPKPPVAAPAKTAASSAADDASGAPDPSAAAKAAETPQSIVAPPPAARPDGGNGQTPKADAPASPTPASPATEPAHEHSPVNAAAHATAGPSDAGLQATGTVQPQGASATAAPAASLSVTPATNAVVPLSGLALEIAVSARSGKSRFEIRLDPADLGRIDVRIDVDRNGQVTSHLAVEKPETLSLLRQDAPQLQQALDDAGLKTGNGGLQFSLRDQSSSGQNNGDQAGRNAHQLIVGDEDAIPAAIAGRTYGRQSGSSSGVDIRV